MTSPAGLFHCLLMTIVAIGASHNDGNGIDAGHVRIYEYNLKLDAMAQTLMVKRV